MLKRFHKNLYMPITYLIFLGIMVITSPVYSMLEEADQNLASSSRKIGRILDKGKVGKKHTFEEGDAIQITLGGKGPSGHTCKNCGQPKSACLGINGGVSEHIKELSKQLTTLLKQMEESI